MAQDYPITLACRNYDGTNAILRGLLRPQGIDLRVAEFDDVPKMFAGMFKGQCDASEMSLAETVYYISRNRCDFIAIPVFPSRLFRHSFILHNLSAGIHGPQDLNGKRIGAMRWVQTAFIWLRGMLVDEYRLSPKETKWYVWALHHWEDPGSENEIVTRDGSVIGRFTEAGSDEYEINCRALVKGSVDALMTTESPRYDALAGETNVRRLFGDARKTEAAYFRKTGILPIMHVIVLRRSLIDRHPELPEKLFTLFCQAKKMGQEWMRSIPSSSLAWKNHYLEEEREIFQGDPWAYGLKKNFAVLTKFLSYCYAQGVSAREISPYELFAPSTWELSE